jgi:hypothetical protein
MHFSIADVAHRVGSKRAILDLRSVPQADHSFRHYGCPG